MRPFLGSDETSRAGHLSNTATLTTKQSTWRWSSGALGAGAYLAPLHAIHWTGCHCPESALGLCRTAPHQGCPSHPPQTWDVLWSWECKEHTVRAWRRNQGTAVGTCLRITRGGTDLGCFGEIQKNISQDKPLNMHQFDQKLAWHLGFHRFRVGHFSKHAEVNKKARTSSALHGSCILNEYGDDTWDLFSLPDFFMANSESKLFISSNFYFQSFQLAQSHKKEHGKWMMEESILGSNVHVILQQEAFDSAAVPASTESPQWVSLASVSIKESPCDASHLPHQRLRTQKSPLSGLWWPLAPAVLQGEDPRAKDTQLGSVFHNELYRLCGDLTENFSSKYFSKAGPAHIFFFFLFPQICILLRFKAFKNRLLCVGGTHLADIKSSTPGLELAASPPEALHR